MRRNNDIRKDDTVVVIRDIHRYDTEGIYAASGETGKVIEVFQNAPGSGSQAKYAKVIINEQCKTLRLTSLQRVED